MTSDQLYGCRIEKSTLRQEKSQIHRFWDFRRWMRKWLCFVWVSSSDITASVLLSHLYKHLANRGASLVGSTVHWHGLPVSGEFQRKLFLHKLLNHLQWKTHKDQQNIFLQVHSSDLSQECVGLDYGEHVKQWHVVLWRTCCAVENIRSL